jgi:hypothetical protein
MTRHALRDPRDARPEPVERPRGRSAPGRARGDKAAGEPPGREEPAKDGSVTEEFVGEEIAVEEGTGVTGPLRFTWRGRHYETAEVESAWHDYGQPSAVGGSTRPGRPEGVVRPNWRTRRHRNCFLVRTRGGERFRVYLDRGTKASAPRAWVLERRLLRARQPRPNG